MYDGDVRRPVFPAVASAVLAVWAGVSALLGWRQIDRAYAEFARRASRFVAGIQVEIADAARVGSEDVLLLARSAAAEGLTRDDPDAIPKLERLLASHVAVRASVFQARLIGPDGAEMLRIERRGDDVVAAATLQNKEDRHYFRQARELPPGQVYVSPLDLNVEYGKVELPPRPTLRFSTPVYCAASGTLLGVFVINRDVKEMIRRVGRARDQMAGTLVLVHGDGEYVSHPDATREWGTPSEARLGSDHPDVARWLAGSTAAGTFRAGGVIAVAGESSSQSLLPRVLLVATEGEALTAQAQGFLPLAIAVASSGTLIALALIFVWRQRRLASELAREAELRRQIVARESRLAETHERLVASARLAALAESATTLAHELRNPLGAIVNSAALLRRDPEVGAESRQLMEIVLGECARLERAVAGFLDLARRPSPRSEEVDLGALAGDVVALAAHEPTLRGEVDLSVGELEPGVPCVHADPDELRQVLWNLLSNAGKATRRADGKRVTVRVCRGSLDGKQAAVLEVVDEGPGPDEPPGASAGPAVGGHGLGLIVAAGIVARSGGKLELEPGPGGRGACARVILPAT
jgi:signal transduction histidine kinase